MGGLYGARGRQEKCLNFYPRPGVLSRLRVNNISSDDQHFRILPSIRKIYQMRDNRKRKIGSKRRIDYTICNFPAIRNITPKNDRFFDSRERNEISSVLTRYFVKTKRDQWCTHTRETTLTRRNVFGVRVCARVSGNRVFTYAWTCTRQRGINSSRTHAHLCGRQAPPCRFCVRLCACV